MLLEKNVRVIFLTNRTVDINGIDNHRVNDIGIGTRGVLLTPKEALSLPLFTNTPC
jgi:hypothetical protein